MNNVNVVNDSVKRVAERVKKHSEEKSRNSAEKNVAANATVTPTEINADNVGV